VPAGRERLLALLDSADVWIESTRPGTLAALGLDPADVLHRNPQLVITSITDFGQDGEYRDWEGNDSIHVAMSGILSRSGLAGRDPLVTPPGMAYETTAMQAAWATLVAYWNRLETGSGDHVDFSILEAAVQVVDPAYGSASVSRASAIPLTRSRPEAGLYPIFRCADGYVRVVVLAPRQWRAMRAWLGEPEAFQDERYDSILGRLEGSAELYELYTAFFAGKTRDEIAAEGQARGVPVAPILDVADVLASEHFESRGAFVDTEVAPGVRGRLPSGSLEIDGARVGFRHRAPEPGEHNGDLAGDPAARPARPSVNRAGPRRPLAGLRVVDFGIIVIGNEIGRLLADQGAEVIKIENRAFPDAARVTGNGKMTQSFVAGSRNKHSFGVNLRTADGVALLKRLVEQADVVLENFKPGTLEKLGLGYETLREVNPEIVMLSTNALGSTGPWSGWMGYGPIVRCVSGITSLWRYPEDELAFGEPTTIYPDHYGARLCATAVLAALIRRRRGGGGARIEAAQAEMILNHLADTFLASSLGAAPAGADWALYPCAGDDEWCVIAVRDEQQRTALRRVLGDRDITEWDADARSARGDGAAAGGRRAGGHDDAPGRPRARSAPAVPRDPARARPARPRSRARRRRAVPLRGDPARPHHACAGAGRAHARDLRVAARPRGVGDRRALRGRRPRGDAAAGRGRPVSLKLGLNVGYWASQAPGPATLEAIKEAERLGFDSVWTSEAYGCDVLTPLAWWGSQTETVKLGTSIMQMSARRPTAAAMAAMTMDHLSGGRFILGLGVSGPQVVEGWYGEPFAKPLARTREYVSIVRDVVARQAPVDSDGVHYPLPVHGRAGITGLGKPIKTTLHPLRERIPIFLAAEGPKNIALTAEIADGWLALYYSPYHDAELYRPCLEEGFARRPEPPDGFEVHASLPFIVDDDVERAADTIRPRLALYFGGMGARSMNFHRDVAVRMGYEAEATKIQDLFLAGKKDEAAAAVPTKLIEELALIGPPDKIRHDLEAWRESRVTSLLIVGTPAQLRQAAELVLG
jgi:F420-dependent oxidoreductase-like protein